MKEVTVTLHVDPATAVRAGKTQCGSIALTLTPEDLAQLTDEQRETLALCLSRGMGVQPHSHKLAEASVESLAAVLDAKRRHEIELADFEAAHRAEQAQRQIELRREVDAWLAAHEHPSTDDFGRYLYKQPSHEILSACEARLTEIREHNRRITLELEEQETRKLLQKAPAQTQRQYQAGLLTPLALREALQGVMDALYARSAPKGAVALEPDWRITPLTALTRSQFAQYESLSCQGQPVLAGRYRDATQEELEDYLQDEDGEVWDFLLGVLHVFPADHLTLTSRFLVPFDDQSEV